MDEHDIERILKRDLSEGTDEFRDDLLARCLAILRSQDEAELDDSDLELLAAAEDLSALGLDLPELPKD